MNADDTPPDSLTASGVPALVAAVAWCQTRAEGAKLAYSIYEHLVCLADIRASESDLETLVTLHNTLNVMQAQVRQAAQYVRDTAGRVAETESAGDRIHGRRVVGTRDGNAIVTYGSTPIYRVDWDKS